MRAEPHPPAGPGGGGIQLAPRFEDLQPGDVFKDGDAPWCPEMVMLPAGRFLMGASGLAAALLEDEGPPHEVEITYRLAVGRYPVTFEEFDQFCAATHCPRPADMGWGHGRRPVINLSWHDAGAYLMWLSHATGRAYQLLSEAEWEYACRAGTTTPFWTGESLTTEQANFNGAFPNDQGETGSEYRQKTTPVGLFQPNPWGLYDMHGNVWEWVEDHFHEAYAGAPSDGGTWLDPMAGPDVLRAYRGGSWGGVAWFARSSCRGAGSPGLPHDDLGFRVCLRSR